MADFEVCTIDVDELNRVLDRMGTRARNLHNYYPVMAQALHLMVDDKFEQEGPGWQPLEESTKERRERAKEGAGSGKILQMNSDLVGSMQPYSEYDYFGVYTNKDYAKYHMHGWGVPVRNPFDVNMNVALERMARDICTQLV